MKGQNGRELQWGVAPVQPVFCLIVLLLFDVLRTANVCKSL